MVLFFFYGVGLITIAFLVRDGSASVCSRLIEACTPNCDEDCKKSIGNPKAFGRCSEGAVCLCQWPC